MRVLITRKVPEVAVRVLREAGHSVTVHGGERDMAAEELLAATESMDGLVAMLTNRIDESYLAQRPGIRAVANFAVGFNNIDVPACTRRGVGVSNTPGVLTDATAETAWMLLMMAARRAGEAERLVRSGTWGGWEPLQMLGVPIVGRTLGIVGAGRIGGRMAEMARGFGMKLFYNNRNANPAIEALGARLVGLEELLRESDFVSVHVPLNETTRHMISTNELALMKPTAVLVNTARGPVIDEGALAEALSAKRIFAAGLDVYEKEPALHPGLAGLENVVLLPHIGSATVETRDRMARMAAENLVAMLGGKRPANAVNPEVWGGR